MSTSSSTENKAVIRCYYDDLWNAWNLEAAASLIAPDIDFRGSLGIAVRGIEAFKGYISTVRAAFPDFHNQVEDLVAEADTVVARLTYQGTHSGEMFGIPATGKAVKYTGIAIFRISAGLIHEGWVMGDAWGLYQQINPISSGLGLH